MTAANEFAAAAALLDAQAVPQDGRSFWDGEKLVSAEPCTACAESARKVSHEFHAGCRGCCARACARGPDFQRVRKVGVQDHRYRLALQHFGLTHDEVKAANAADKAGQS